MPARMTPRAAIALVGVLATVLVLASTAFAARPAEVTPEVAAKLQSLLDRWLVNHRAPGVAAAVRFPDGSLWLGTSGTAQVGTTDHPVTIDTPFAIGSLTKTFMAALVLQLEEQGYLSLGDPISRWLPDYPRADAIDVRMLLNHRSGIFDYFAHPRYPQLVFGRPRHRWSIGEILSLTGRPYCRPSKCFRYSNTNYVLLARIVRKATGASAAQLIRARFLGPLGLEDTFFQGQEPVGKWPAEGYWTMTDGYRGFSDGSLFRPNTSAATVASAAGAMVSSIQDVSDWQDALLGGRVLGPEALAEMLRFHRKSGYGLGMRTAWLNGLPGIGHGGSLRGFVAIMYRLPEQDLDVAIVTNLGNVTVQGLADNLTRAALRSLEPPVPETSPVPESSPVPSG